MQTAPPYTGLFTRLPVFLTIVCVVRDSAASLEAWAEQLAAEVKPLVRDYDIVFVDNASEDESLAVLQKMTGPGGCANIQVFGLAKKVDQDTAVCIGLESALGDYVAVIDPLADDIKFLREMLYHAVLGADVVFAKNSERAPQTFSYTVANILFNRLYKRLGGVDLNNEAPRYRILARKVVNFLLKHPHAYHVSPFAGDSWIRPGQPHLRPKPCASPKEAHHQRYRSRNADACLLQPHTDEIGDRSIVVRRIRESRLLTLRCGNRPLQTGCGARVGEYVFTAIRYVLFDLLGIDGVRRIYPDDGKPVGRRSHLSHSARVHECAYESLRSIKCELRRATEHSGAYEH